MRFEGVANVDRSGLGDASERVYDRGDAAVGGAENPAAVFDGAHPHHPEMLESGAGVAKPSVVRNVDEDIGAGFGEEADLIGEDGFVADKGAGADRSSFEQSAVW